MKKEYNKVEQQKTDIEQQNEKQEESTISTAKIAQATPVKKGIFSRVGNALFGTHGLKSITSYVGQEIVVPALKGIIVDGFIAGVTSAVYGDEKSGYQPIGGGRSNYRSTNTNYTRYSNRYQSSPSTNVGGGYSPNVRASNRIGEYAIDNREDAVGVLTRLQEIADKYNSVTVADYYEMIGVQTEYTDNNYGWTIEDLVRVNIIRTPSGFVLTLPRTRSLV